MKHFEATTAENEFQADLSQPANAGDEPQAQVAPKTLHELALRARRLSPNQMSVGRLLLVSNCLGVLLACAVLSLPATLAAAIMLLFLAPAVVGLAVAIDLFCVRYFGFQCFPPRKLHVKHVRHRRSPFDDPQ